MYKQLLLLLSVLIVNYCLFLYKCKTFLPNQIISADPFHPRNKGLLLEITLSLSTLPCWCAKTFPKIRLAMKMKSRHGINNVCIVHNSHSKLPPPCVFIQFCLIGGCFCFDLMVWKSKSKNPARLRDAPFLTSHHSFPFAFDLSLHFSCLLLIYNKYNC